MRSNQKLQNTLEEIKSITGLDSVLYSPDGNAVAHTVEPDEKPALVIADFLEADEVCTNREGMIWYKIRVEGEIEYVYCMYSAGQDVSVIGQMAACQIKTVAESFAEQYDRNNFMQNVLLGNMLKVDIYAKSKKLHIEPANRVVYVIDTGKKHNDLAIELVKNLSDMRSRDFVTSIDEHSAILVKDVSMFKEDVLERELQGIANRLVDNLHTEAMIKVRVGYGNVVSQVPDIAQSYQEARMALEVGKVFYAEYDTISYGKLGIGRLIYQLPMSLCDMYIKEVFGDKIPEILDDEEAMSTINKFFENNLNISETARQLYVHRNTLVYRLERIEKAIGLDIRSFDDAMTFRIAVMVIAHIRAQNEKEYK